MTTVPSERSLDLAEIALEKPETGETHAQAGQGRDRGRITDC